MTNQHIWVLNMLRSYMVLYQQTCIQPITQKKKSCSLCWMPFFIAVLTSVNWLSQYRTHRLNTAWVVIPFHEKGTKTGVKFPFQQRFIRRSAKPSEKPQDVKLYILFKLWNNYNSFLNHNFKGAVEIFSGIKGTLVVISWQLTIYRKYNFTEHDFCPYCYTKINRIPICTLFVENYD